MTDLVAAPDDKIRRLQEKSVVDPAPDRTYTFGDYRLLPGERQLLRHDTPVSLAPKTFDVLQLLVERHGRLVDKDEFLQTLWPGTFVEETTLAHVISDLRKALGRAGAQLIETVPKRGYRFVGEVVSFAGPRVPIVVAVLPFENLSPTGDLDYLGEGLTEELIAALGQVDPEHLHVIGRTTVAAYKRTTQTLSVIGRELNAAYLIESSIRVEGGRIRLTSKLVRVEDQVLVWSASYDSEPQSLLGFQRELSTTLAAQVKLRLSPTRLDMLTRRQTENAAAYDSYLRGRYYWNQFTPLTTRRAVESYVKATDLDPGYALAWSGLADALASSPIHADAPPREVSPRARDAAERALKSGPELAEVHTSLGLLQFWLDWRWPAAERSLRRALVIDPTYTLAHRMLGIVLAHMGGRADEARAEMHRARALEPLQPMDHALSAQVAFVIRDFDAAVEFGRQATVIAPEFWVGHYQIAQAFEQLDRHDEALDALARAGEFGGGNSKVISLRGYILAKTGGRAEALRVLNALSGLSRDRYVPPYANALVSAALGRDDDVVELLNRAVDVHDVHLVLLPQDPKWDRWRSDSRFDAVLARAGLPHVLPVGA